MNFGLIAFPSTECFRKLYDVIDNSTIALEWLDTTLAEVKYQPNMCTYFLIRSVLRAVLTTCVTLQGHKYVNTGRVTALEELVTTLDYKPANILLSGIRSNRVVAKVGDLGLGEHYSFIDETRFT